MDINLQLNVMATDGTPPMKTCAETSIGNGHLIVLAGDSNDSVRPSGIKTLNV